MDNSPPAFSAADQPPRFDTSPCVLVVDDSATNRVVLEKQLHKLGCRVLSARDGCSGLQAIGQGGIDLVLLDCQMPDISGYQVARQVRTQAAVSGATHIPIIAVSGDTDAGHHQLCIDSGMDDVLLKPIAVAQLRHLLLHWCSARVAPASAAAEAATAAGAAAAQLHSLYRQTSLQDFVMLRQSAEQGDRWLLARRLHRMKGAALAVQALQVVAMLEQIEAMSMAGSQCPAAELEVALEVLRQLLEVA